LFLGWGSPVAEFIESGTFRLVAYLTLLAVLVAVGCYLVSRFRGRDEQAQGDASDLLTSFSELYDRGELSDQEYRTIKARLGEKLREELKRSDGPG